MPLAVAAPYHHPTAHALGLTFLSALLLDPCGRQAQGVRLACSPLLLTCDGASLY